VPKYEVPVTGPDGGQGTITVNATDEASAYENAGQGGNTPTGSPTLVANGPNSLDSQGSPSGAGSINTKTTTGGGAATTGSTTGSPGTAFPWVKPGQGGKPEDRSKAIYEGREGESLQDWMSRVFQQGTRDFGGTLAPDSDNPFGRSPYASWFQRRYADVVPANLLLQNLLTNTGRMEDFGKNTETGMQNFIGTGEGRGWGTGSAGAGQNLGSLNDLMNAFNGGNTSNLSEDQQFFLGGVNDDPRVQMALINAQLSGGAGANPVSSKYINSIGAQMLDEYYDDPVGHDPATNGTFLNNFMKKFNMGRTA